MKNMYTQAVIIDNIDMRGINPSIYMHKIILEDDYKTSINHN